MNNLGKAKLELVLSERNDGHQNVRKVKSKFLAEKSERLEIRRNKRTVS